MSNGFALGSFLARWSHRVRHDLSASECATRSLTDLLAMAGEADRRRWAALDFGYATPHGAGWLRHEIARRHDGIGADDVLCCAGAQEAVACVMRALLAPDDHAIVVVPIYQPCERAVTAICPASGVALEERQGIWRLDLDRVAAAIRRTTRVVLMNFPNSPTGAVIQPDALAALVELCRRHGLWLVNDEVYRMVGNDPLACPPAVADIYERGVSISALSKGFGLPGLRVGWVVSRDRKLLARVLQEKSGLSSCLATPSEVLAHIALQAEDVILARNRAIAEANREALLHFLAQHAPLFVGTVARHAVLAFPRYLGAEGAERFAARLIHDAGILVLPSTLWATDLAELPTDRLRIGLGQPGLAAGLDALSDSIATRTAASLFDPAD